MDTDFLLIRRMKRGDEAAFDIFVHKYYESILTYCCYHCPIHHTPRILRKRSLYAFLKNSPITIIWVKL